MCCRILIDGLSTSIRRKKFRMNQTESITILSGIYPPDMGGPARFALTFSGWLQQQNIQDIHVISYTNDNNTINKIKNITVSLVSRKYRLLKRYTNAICQIISINSNNNLVLANGMFLEVLIAKILKPKIKYVAKVPGDIVWERSRNMGRTHLSINDFQKSRLHIRDYVQRIFFTLSLRMAYKVIVPSIELSEMCIYWG